LFTFSAPPQNICQWQKSSAVFCHEQLKNIIFKLFVINLSLNKENYFSLCLWVGCPKMYRTHLSQETDSISIFVFFLQIPGRREPFPNAVKVVEQEGLADLSVKSSLKRELS